MAIGRMLLLTILTAGTAAAGPITLLEANFDDKTIDAPIGTGGADLGEPVSSSSAVTAIVRATPMGSPSLEISDNNDSGAGGVRFEMYDGIEVTDGVLAFTFDLWFTDLENFYVYVREQGSSAKSFLSMRFQSSGDIRYNDTAAGELIGTYETGRVIPVAITFNQNAGTYSIVVDGLTLLENRAHGVTDRGVGAILIGCTNDGNIDGTFSVDNLVATGDGVTPSETVTWGAVKSAF